MYLSSKEQKFQTKIPKRLEFQSPFHSFIMMIEHRHNGLELLAPNVYY